MYYTLTAQLGLFLRLVLIGHTPVSSQLRWVSICGQAYCLQSDAAMQELLPALPRRIFAMTTRGDMLLPTHKHAVFLVDAGREYATFHGGVDLMTVEGPLTANHGCGLRDWWADESRQWLLDVLVETDTDDPASCNHLFDDSLGSEQPQSHTAGVDAPGARQP